MEKVKFTFEKSTNGDTVIIRKDGGFTVEDMTMLTKAVEEMFHEPELEPGEPDKLEDYVGGNDSQSSAVAKRSSEPGGRV